MDELKVLEDLKNIVINKNFNYRDKELYFNDFKRILNYFKENISKEKYDEILKKINGVSTEKSENKIYKFYQFVAELVVGKYLLKNFADSFQSEVKLIKDKNTDVDYQIEYNNIKYNIEVKCPHFKVKDEYHKDNENLKISFLSRGRTKEEYNTILKEIEEDIITPILQKSNYPNYRCGKLEDDKIKDFLISGQSKFPDDKDNDHLNILMIGLDSPMDIVEWYSYFTNQITGFFTCNSYIKHEEFNKVDMVIISNVVSGHRDLKKIDEFDCWELDNYFNYFLVNPFSLKNKEANKKNMYGVYQELKNDGTLNSEKQLNEFLDILRKIYEDSSKGYDITEEEMIAAVIDYTYNEPIVYSHILDNIFYFKFVKKIGDYNLKKMYEYVNDIIPNKTLEFESFRKKVIEEYESKNASVTFINSIYDVLFNDYISENYKELVNI